LIGWVTECRQGAGESQAAATCHGPISQRQLLQGLGIDARLQALLKTADADQADMLQTGYLRLVGEGASATASVQGDGRQKGEQQDQPAQEGMGLTYQAMAITSEDAPVPVAFGE
jgi:hypothetical protein